MVKVIFAVAGGVIFVSILLAWFAAAHMMRYRKAGVPLSWYAWNGWAFFTGRNFEPPAEPSRRLFILCVVAFFIGLVAFIAFGLIGWPDPNATPPG